METINSISERMRRDFPRKEGTESNHSGKSPLNNGLFGDPNCPICHGIGYVSREHAVGDPDFGKMEPCSCRLKEIAEKHSAAQRLESNLGSYGEMTFETFNTCGRGGMQGEQRTAVQEALEYAKNQAMNYASNPKGWMLFTGRYGTGKTHLAAAIANQALENGISNIFQPVPDLLDFLRSAFSGGSESYTDRLERIKSIQLLILDDLGTQNTTPWAEEKLFQIINHRYVNKLPTVITTNNDFHIIEGRIASRLADPLVLRVHLDVPDYRDPLALTRQQGANLSILHLMTEKTFDTFDSRKNETLSSAASVQLAQAYSESYQFAADPQGWLVLVGPSGIGKTHLAAAIGNHCKLHLDDGDTPVMVTASDLLDHLRATYAPGSLNTYDTVFDQVRNTQLLILLNLDTMNATSWAKEKMYQVLNYRYLAQMPTVITLIKPVQEMDPIIRSRIVDKKFCSVMQMFDIPMYSCNPEIDLNGTAGLPGRSYRATRKPR